MEQVLCGVAVVICTQPSKLDSRIPLR